MKKTQLRHSYHWYNTTKESEGYCYTCKKEVEKNSAYHFDFKQQQKLI